MIGGLDEINGTFEQKKQFVSQFNLMDDTFFSVVMENRAACEYLLTALLNKPVKYIKNNKTQYSLKSAEDHSIVLDVICKDKDGNIYNIEIQIADRKNLKERVRFYRALIDSRNLKKGEDYSQLPDLYVIFITAFDPFKENRNHYSVLQHLDTGTEYEDGSHIMFFNTAVKDGSDLSELLQYLADSNVNVRKFGALSRAVRRHKTMEKGVEQMCRIVEEYSEKRAKRDYAKGKREGRIEGKIEAVNEMLKDNIPLELALRYGKIDLDTYNKYNNQELQ